MLLFASASARLVHSSSGSFLPAPLGSHCPQNPTAKPAKPHLLPANAAVPPTAPATRTLDRTGRVATGRRLKKPDFANIQWG